jgi:putative GTP pyrophosphokinase
LQTPDFWNLDWYGDRGQVTFQKFEKVHSVRWRIKDTNHLLAKIVRKRAAGEEKYAEITVDNYHQVITDLVGIRAIHLFKEDFFAIDRALRREWQTTEQPIVYIRDGDQGQTTKNLAELGFAIRVHPAGYRSVHYVGTSQPISRKVFVEVQVRTIFEEGWSEIDHSVRYPKTSSHELVDYFLAIFNRMAGSADDMGGFVSGLTSKLDEFNAKLSAAKIENEKTVSEMQNLLSKLASEEKQGAVSKKHVAALSAELEKIKSTVERGVSLSFLNPSMHPATNPFSLVSDPTFRGGMPLTLAEGLSKGGQLTPIGGYSVPRVDSSVFGQPIADVSILSVRKPETKN